MQDSDFDPEESDEDDVEAAQRENGSDKVDSLPIIDIFQLIFQAG